MLVVGGAALRCLQRIDQARVLLVGLVQALCEVLAAPVCSLKLLALALKLRRLLFNILQDLRPITKTGQRSHRHA